MSKVWKALARVDHSKLTPANLAEIYGTTKRGGVDTAKAAAALGVSRRTIQRWIHTGKFPATTAGVKAQQTVQQHRQSPAGRRAALSSRREDRMRKHGTTLQLKASIQISGDRRKRYLEVPVDGAHMAPIIDAALNADDQAAQEALETALADLYFGGACTITSLDDLATFR